MALEGINEDKDIAFTQDVRRKLIKAIVNENSDGSVQVPQKGGIMLVQLLDGMDRVTLTKVKIKSDEKQASDGGKAIVAAFLASINATDLKPKAVTEVDPLLLEMPATVYTENDSVSDNRMMSIGTQKDDMESFNTRMGIDGSEKDKE